MPQNWVNVGSEAQFPDGLHTVALGKRRVVIARLEGRLYSFDALCPHAQGPMEKAEIEGTIVSCPLHAWRYDLQQGGKELHGYRDLATYEVTVTDGQVYLAIES